MTKTTLCLLFVLALIAQIAAIPVDKAEAGVEEAAREGKRKIGDEGEHIVDAIKAADKHKADVADVVAGSVDKPKKDERAPSHGHPHPTQYHPGKDSDKPRAGRPLTKVVDKVTDVEKKLADVGANAVKDFFKLFGMQ